MCDLSVKMRREREEAEKLLLKNDGYIFWSLMKILTHWCKKNLNEAQTGTYKENYTKHIIVKL